MSEAVLVTGASSGIGEDAARTLAQRGFIVFAGVRNDADGARVATLHDNIRPVLLDVTNADHVAAAAETVAERGIPLRALVNNAGIAIGGPLEYLPLAELRRVFDVNLFGQIAVMQALLPLLRQTRGRLVFVGSISGRLAAPFVGPYSASKFALRAVADALRIELRPAGIGVSLIEPGAVKTPIWKKGRESRQRLLALFPPQALERYGAALEKLFAVTEREERVGMPVDRVSVAIVHAVTAPRPRATYLLGTPAKAGSVIAMLPPALRDRAVRASMGLP
jgi:NAD(P)-dependent dehydrogenase (short-subunit alcohol dehydrogenase family)